MRRQEDRQEPRGYLGSRLRGESGIVIVVVMMFCLIFLVIGLSLYWLTTGHIKGTESERKNVKSFNVAEAGVDAGMLALKLEWPFTAEDGAVFDVAEDLVYAALRAENDTLHLAENSDDPEGDFVQVIVYDNSVSGVTVTEPPVEDDRVTWDANGDGKMYVDAVSNVQDNRHRILLLAERQVWNLYFPVGVALFSGAVGSNGTGFDIEIENGSPPVYYDVNDILGKGINSGGGVAQIPTGTEFEENITPALQRALMSLAIEQGTYFTTGAAASTFLTSSSAPGSIVYVKSDTAVDISGSMQMGTVEEPIVVIIDTPDGTENSWDMRGTADFYGIVVVLGDTLLRGTCSIHGAAFTEGTMTNKGTGSSAELYYNDQIVKNINRVHTLSVNVVANSWEEYTGARSE